MEETLLQWISQYGYLAIFFLLMLGIVGLPIPDEVLLTFSGYLVFKGQLALAPTMASAFLGSICGVSVSYSIGRTRFRFLSESSVAGFMLRMKKSTGYINGLNRKGNGGFLSGISFPA